MPKLGTTVLTLASYLPQFHPTDFNDAAWGKGYTEWTAVNRAQPLFKDHLIARPADEPLGQYDLRNKSTRLAQYELAKQHGVDAFLMWHYWFEGKTLFGEVYEQVLRDEPGEFKFALAWANESWTGKWHGLESQIHFRQTYGGYWDERAHVSYLSKFMTHPNYARLDGRPILYLYNFDHHPNAFMLIERMNEFFVESGLTLPYWIVQSGSSPAMSIDALNRSRIIDGLACYDPIPSLTDTRGTSPLRFDIESVYRLNSVRNAFLNTAQIRLLIPNWDTTPRLGNKGRVVHSSPQRWHDCVKSYVDAGLISNGDIVIIKSWNEWGEGNYLEPDVEFGLAWLESWAKAINVLKIQAR